MINFSGISSTNPLGKLLRLPFRLLPRNLVVPIIQGPLRGKKWILGSSDLGCWLGSYEFEKQRLMAKVIKPGTVVFDIGAHVGYYTLLTSSLVGDSGRVFTFEPLPRNIDYIQKHLQLNSIHNVTLFRAAVSDGHGMMSFREGKEDSTGRLDERGTISVEVVSLDELFFQGVLPFPDFIKIDVEGGEFSVLKGAQHILGKDCLTIFLATHGCEVHSRCLSLLESLGYVCRPLDPAMDVASCNELVASKGVDL
jgi:FkbM family methyltransferase